MQWCPGGRPRAEDRGETLVELLIAVVILGIGAGAIFAGLAFSVKASDIGRKQATGGAYVRSFAEAIQSSVTTSGGYKACTSSTPNYLTAAVLSQANLPTGYTPSVLSVQAWNGSTWSTCNGTTENGVQLLTLQVKSSGAGVHIATEKLTVTLRRPCAGTPGASACA